MGSNTAERKTLIHELELKRRDSIHKTDNIGRDEEARLLKLKLLALRDDNATLKDKISQRDARIAAFTKQGDQVRIELDEGKEAARAQETRMKKQDLELANLKAEVNSLNGSMQDSGKALQEKFSLTRELNRLRPEMEHLQSQLANYQAMVAEKNNLRRQVDSLEVELENEKRSRQRVQFKEDDATIGELKARLEKAEQKLAADKKEREKARKENERALAEAQAVSERLDERVESLKAKYKTAQGELKETRAQLETLQAELEKCKKTASQSIKEPAKKSATMESGLNRKRRAQEMSFGDITIQTPGNGETPSKRPVAKKRGTEKAAVGEKSAFSITPFLNRTKNPSDESLEAWAHDLSDAAGPDSTFAGKGDSTAPSEVVPEPETQEPVPETAPEEPAPKAKAKTKAKTKTETAPKTAPRPHDRLRAKALAEATPAQTNKAISKAASTTSLQSKTMEMAAEVSVTADQENVTVTASRKAPAIQPKAAEGEVKKKRRKLLGAANQTLFDDDEGEAASKPAKPAEVAPGKRVRTQLGGGVRNAFAGSSFSPLKRARRGVNASFLA
ncbi:Uncharacterized protein TCAP_03146 [Tolypocladium capitatum]|uniref:Uncharacterized protein n=1 Tax=Tolypocladium capitatum TaxID=45235 RepID=A0A2K3QHA9_9HYPO|nr:Uncharacterized protein TCAP_03146 [Tolypocladium capitatum]